MNRNLPLALAAISSLACAAGLPTYKSEAAPTAKKPRAAKHPKKTRNRFVRLARRVPQGHHITHRFVKLCDLEPLAETHPLMRRLAAWERTDAKQRTDAKRALTAA